MKWSYFFKDSIIITQSFCYFLKMHSVICLFVQIYSQRKLVCNSIMNLFLYNCLFSVAGEVATPNCRLCKLLGIVPHIKEIVNDCVPGDAHKCSWEKSTSSDRGLSDMWQWNFNRNSWKMYHGFHTSPLHSACLSLSNNPRSRWCHFLPTLWLSSFCSPFFTFLIADKLSFAYLCLPLPLWLTLLPSLVFPSHFS